MDIRTLHAMVSAAAKGARDMCQSARLASGQQHYYACVGYPTYIRQYNMLAEHAVRMFPTEASSVILQICNVPMNTMGVLFVKYAEYAELACSQLEMLEAFLRTQLAPGDERFLSLADHIKANLRASLFETPQDEKAVQNALDVILRAGGWDYMREKEAIPYSAKTYRPDFTIMSLNLALEVKLCADASKVKRLVDEMNADIPAYASKYSKSLFVVYDLGHIRDESEFRSGIEANPGVSVIIIKH